MRRIIASAAVLALLFSGAALAQSSFILTVAVQPEMSLSSQESTLPLKFQNYAQGSRSNVRTAGYRIQANNLSSGSIQGIVAAKLKDPLERVELSASFQNYENLGEKGFSVPRAVQPGFQPVTTSGTALATKEGGDRGGSRVLDGRFFLAWQATLTEEAPAETQTASVTITVKDVE